MEHLVGGVRDEVGDSAPAEATNDGGGLSGELIECRVALVDSIKALKATAEDLAGSAGGGEDEVPGVVPVLCQSLKSMALRAAGIGLRDRS